MSERNAFGPYTGVRLDETDALFSPTRGPEGLEPLSGAPGLSAQAAQLSLELARTAYQMDFAPWHRAGWTDFSLLVNGALYTGERLNGGKGLTGDLARNALQALTQLRLAMPDSFGQYAELRKEGARNAEACKAVVMLRPDREGFLVAVGFMGTGRHIDDWAANLRMTLKDGLHEGFLQLAEEFFAQRTQIEFPTAAAALGRERLTLQDILSSLRGGEKIFRIWSAGHSQGAAIMQVVFDRLLSFGVPADRLCGWGFASPTVADAAYPGARRRYPITHLMNADDTVPRIGASLHLGACYLFAPNRADQVLFYGDRLENPAFPETLALLRSLSGTEDALLCLIAVLSILNEQPLETLQHALNGLEPRLTPDWLRSLTEEKTLPLIGYMAGRMTDRYHDVTGRAAPDERRYALILGRHRNLIERYGFLLWLRAVKNAGTLPHKLCRDEERALTAPYQYMTTEGFARLRRLPQTASSPLPLSFAEHRRCRRFAPAPSPRLSEQRKFRRYPSDHAIKRPSVSSNITERPSPAPAESTDAALPAPTAVRRRLPAARLTRRAALRRIASGFRRRPK